MVVGDKTHGGLPPMNSREKFLTNRLAERSDELECMRVALAELIKATDFIGSGVVDWRKWVEDAADKARAILYPTKAE